MKSLEEIRAALEGKGYQVEVEGNTLTATRDHEVHQVRVEAGMVYLQTTRPTKDLVEAVL